MALSEETGTKAPRRVDRGSELQHTGDDPRVPSLGCSGNPRAKRVNRRRQRVLRRDAIANQFPEVPLLAEPENHGFARANNIGAKHAGGDYIPSLNPYTVVLDEPSRWRLAREPERAFMSNAVRLGVPGRFPFAV